MGRVWQNLHTYSKTFRHRFPLMSMNRFETEPLDFLPLISNLTLVSLNTKQKMRTLGLNTEIVR